jgi:hypothetical protein
MEIATYGRVSNGGHVSPLSSSVNVDNVVDRLDGVPGVRSSVGRALSVGELVEGGDGEQVENLGTARRVVTEHGSVDGSHVGGSQGRAGGLTTGGGRGLELVAEVLSTEVGVGEAVLAERVGNSDSLGSSSRSGTANRDGGVGELTRLARLKVRSGPVPVGQTNVAGSRSPASGLRSSELGGLVLCVLGQALLHERKVGSTKLLIYSRLFIRN